MPKRCPNDVKTTPKRCQNDAKTMPKRCRNDAKTLPKRCHNDAKTMPKRNQNDAKPPPKRRQNAAKTPPKRYQTPPPSHFRCFLWGKHTIRARGESNRLPPGSDPPTSRGPDHYANPAPEPRPLSGFLCTGIHTLGEQCASIVVRPEKHDF